MAAILHMPFSNAFSWMEMFDLKEKLIEICSLRANWYVSIVSNNALVLNRQKSIIWSNNGFVY